MIKGVYIHIPFCVQRCTYCDFATYDLISQQKELPTPDDYLGLLKKEIRLRAKSVKAVTLETLYFGGGTPSLLTASQLLSVVNQLKDSGLNIDSSTELTVEINPATMDEAKLESYLKIGINRFSVGFQTLNEKHLAFVKRKHSAQDSKDLAELLSKFKLNYSLDLLYSLPYQTLEDLKIDLDYILNLAPPHISPYILTVPEGHVLWKIRPLEGIQVDMFKLVREEIRNAGYQQYEISNFAKLNKHSRHNSLYWADESYIGFGLSSHSYSKNHSPQGTRFWNPKSMKEYIDWAQGLTEVEWQNPVEFLKIQNFEVLTEEEALTDFTHTRMRTTKGLVFSEVEARFSRRAVEEIKARLSKSALTPLLNLHNGEKITLTDQGQLLSNIVFSELVFSA